MLMVDLKGQYLKIKDEVDSGIREVLESSSFINGPAVKRFRENLGRYMGGTGVITCANGTDALRNLRPDMFSRMPITIFLYQFRIILQIHCLTITFHVFQLIINN